MFPMPYCVRHNFDGTHIDRTPHSYIGRIMYFIGVSKCTRSVRACVADCNVLLMHGKCYCITASVFVPVTKMPNTQVINYYSAALGYTQITDSRDTPITHKYILLFLFQHCTLWRKAERVRVYSVVFGKNPFYEELRYTRIFSNGLHSKTDRRFFGHFVYGIYTFTSCCCWEHWGQRQYFMTYSSSSLKKI